MITSEKPLVAITMGDPCGIGPEVIVKGLAAGDIQAVCRPLIVGSVAALESAASVVQARVSFHPRSMSDIAAAGRDPRVVDVLDSGHLRTEDITVGKISAKCGEASVQWIHEAAGLMQRGVVRAMATAPINKEAAQLAGHKEIGHQEILQRLTGAPLVATMLLSGHLRVVHLTTHKPLRRAPDFVTRDNILAVLRLTHRQMEAWGHPRPKIGVAGLNPHNSDGGLLGDEEETQIAPGVAAARAEGIDAVGPVPADIVFHQAIRRQYDVTLAMYHDQGHIPIKVFGFERSVTVNLGLPFIRTSVDHGTAFDIAGKGIASEVSMVEAIKLAASLASGRGLPTE